MHRSAPDRRASKGLGWSRPWSCTLVGPGTGDSGPAREINVGTRADPRPLRDDNDDGQWNLPRIAQKRAVTTNVGTTRQLSAAAGQ